MEGLVAGHSMGLHRSIGVCHVACYHTACSHLGRERSRGRLRSWERPQRFRGIDVPMRDGMIISLHELVVCERQDWDKHSERVLVTEVRRY